MDILKKLTYSERVSYEQRISNCNNMFKGHSVEIVVDKVSGVPRLNSFECKHYGRVMANEVREV